MVPQPWPRMDYYDTYCQQHSLCLLCKVSCFFILLKVISSSVQARHSIVHIKTRSSCALLTINSMAAVYNALGIPWASSLLGFIAAALMPVPWVLFKWGPQIRSRSHYDTIKVDVSEVEEA